MADNLIFPVKFDLETAVRKAQGDADKYLRQLQTTIHSKPLAIDLKIVNAGSGSLNEISKRMKDIVTEWNNMSEAERIASKTSGEYTDRAKKLIAEFARLTGASETYARSLQQIVAASRRAANEQEKAMEKQRKTQAILLANEKSIANITAKLKYWKDIMNSSDMGGKRFRKAAEEVRRLNQSLGEAQRNVNSLTGQFKKQDGYVSRLVKRLVVYAGFQQISNFLTSVRSVTAEFELQRISLGAIIQDQAKANALFSEIKNFALKSPIKILDLTKYTKQLAAYKIGVNELFDTTKRLADISIGIGTSMDRLILLYGQVRATGYLRASEIRQATEAGIPLVEELANKLSEANGTLVTSAQVLKMVEERAISFEMVKEVFEDMTNAGGLFYDMQEKQGNTLYGMWQKLGDAAAMMYDEIGNTPWVNEGMKEAINMLRTLMIEWKRAGVNIATLGVAMLLYANKTKLATLATKLNTTANTEGSTALRGRILHLKKAIMYQNLFATSTTTATTATKLFTFAHLRLAQALNLVATGFKKLSAALIKNIWGLVLIGVSLLVEHLLLAKDRAKELKDELADISLDYESKQGQDAANLEYLANAAVNAAKGSKAQKDALEELKNTYGKIIPMELLTIENLERMKGNYGELIALIDEYNLKQKYEKETSAIESSFAPKEEERANKIRNILREGLRLDYADEATGGVFDKVLDLSERNIQRFLLNLKKYADEGLDKKEQVIRASADLAAELGLNEGETEALTNAMIDLDRHELEGQGTLMDYTEALHQKHEAMEEVTDDYERQKKALNEYSAVVDEVLKKNEKEPEVTANKDEFENEKARLNNQISDVASGIVELLNKANVAVDEGTRQILNTVIQNGGMIPDAVWDILEKAAEAANNPKLLAAIQDLRKHYKGLAPDDETVNFVKNGFIKIVSAAQGQMKEYRQYLYDGKTTIKEYQDFLQKSIESLRDQAFEMIRVNALIDAGLVEGQKYDEATIKAAQEKADALQAVLDKYVAPLVRPDDKESKSKGGTKSDPRLQTLQEIANKMAEVNKEYDELLKKEGQTKALADTQKLFASSFKQMEATAKKYGFKLPAFEVPQAIEDVQKWYKAIMDNIKRLNLKNADKVLIELGFKSDKAAIDKQQKEIEKQLKALSDRISRTKTAKEFYEKILGMTGDYDLAAKVSLSIYGDTGYDLQKQLAEQVRQYFQNDQVSIEIPVDVITADNRINYKRLGEFAEQMKEKLGEEPYKAIKKIAEEGQKDLAKTYEGYLKDLEKAKTYSDKRIELARYTANQIAEIEKSTLPKSEKERLTAGYREREDKEAAKLEYEAFKETPMYVQMFEDLDNASTTMLRNMRDMLNQLKGKWGETLEPTQLKEMQSRLNAISEQLAKRNPFKAIGEGIGKIRALNKEYGSLKNVEKELATATKQLLNNKDALTAALQAEAAARAEYDKVVAESGADSAATKNAKGSLDSATALVNQMRKNVNLTEQEVKLLQEIIDKFKDANDEVDDGFKGIGEYVAKVKEAQDAIKGAVEEWTALGDDELWNTIFDGLDKMALSAEQGGEAVAAYFQGDYFTMVTKGISSIANLAAGIGKLFWGSKVAKANKEIKRQEQLLKQLEYTYSRLGKAAEKVFGADFVANQRQQERILRAQQQAYMKQYEAEKSKGKKADEDKMQEFLDKAREVGDEIADMHGRIAEKLLGTDLTSAARDFAQAWLDAYKEFGNTADAMSKKFREMIENMVVESLLARVMERALRPAFDMVDSMGDADFYSEDFWKRLMHTAEQGAQDADHGAAVIMAWVEKMGLNLRELGGEMTGISRDIATASEESVNGLAAGITTQNYYIAQQLAEIQRIRALVEAGLGGSPAAGNGLDYGAMHAEAMGHLGAISQHTAETVSECRNIAARCEEEVALLRRVIVARGGRATHGIAVYMQS